MIFHIFSLIYSFSSGVLRIMNSQNEQLPVGLITYMGGNCTGITKVMSSNSVQASMFCNCTINPLSPSSDQHQISPCSINAYSTPEVMRIKDMITQGEFS